MKKFITLVILSAGMLIGFAPEATAQFSGPLLSQYSLPLDTLSNATTKFEKVKINGYFDVTTIQLVATKISGTAAATVTLQGSLDGVNFYTIGSTYTVTDVATQSAVFSINPSTALWYRLQVVGTGTQSVKLTAQYIVRSTGKN